MWRNYGIYWKNYLTESKLLLTENDFVLYKHFNQNIHYHSCIIYVLTFSSVN